MASFSDRFSRFIPFILAAETVFARGHYGDYSRAVCECVKGDTGGLTKYGVDAASHPGIDIRALTKDTAEDVYFGEWRAERIETFPYPFGECFFDTAVNCGLSRARKIQAKAGTADAGKFLDERAGFYKRLAQAKPIDEKFERGWQNRITDLRQFLKLKNESN